MGGMSKEVKGEGTHFKLPWFQRFITYNVRSTPRNIKSLTGSRDLQMVDINLRIIYRPQIDKLPEMYRTLGLDYDERYDTRRVMNLIRQRPLPLSLSPSLALALVNLHPRSRSIEIFWYCRPPSRRLPCRYARARALSHWNEGVCRCRVGCVGALALLRRYP